MNFGANLKIELYYNCMTQRQLSDKLGIGYSTLTKYSMLKNPSLPNVEIAYKIAKELNTTVEYMLTGKDPIVKNRQTLPPELNEYIQLPEEYRHIVKNLIHELHKCQYINSRGSAHEDRNLQGKDY